MNIFSESPADFIEKMKGSPALHFHISKDGDTWVWEAHIGEFKSKTVRKKGEAHPLGAHAPGYKVHSDKKILIQNVKTFSSGTNAQTV